MPFQSEGIDAQGATNLTLSVPLPHAQVLTMIVNGTLTYTSATPSFFYRELSNTTLNLIAIAAVTTLLSYQAAALISDLLLGFKTRRVASASALQTLLLVRRSSPLSVFANVLRSDRLTRCYYGADIPSGTTIARDHEQVRIGSAMRLFILLLAGPLVAVASVVLTVTKGESMSFSEAGFRGMGFGLSNPDAVQLTGERTSQACATVPLEVGGGDASLADFALCSLPMNTQEGFALGEGGVAVAIASNSSMFLTVNIDKALVSRRKAVSVFTGEFLYFLQPELPSVAVDRFLDYSMERVARACGTDRKDETDQEISYVNQPTHEHIAARFLPCEVSSFEDSLRLATEILLEIEEYSTFVDAEKLMVAEYVYTDNLGGVPILPFFDGGKLPLLTRRRRYLALSALSILTVIVMLLRTVVMMVCSNDVGIGLERIVKETLGYNCCDSLLDKKAIACYSSKHQDGHVAHYGLPRDDMSRVERFSGGVLGQRRRELQIAGLCEGHQKNELSTDDSSWL